MTKTPKTSIVTDEEFDKFERVIDVRLNGNQFAIQIRLEAMTDRFDCNPEPWGSLLGAVARDIARRFASMAEDQRTGAPANASNVEAEILTAMTRYFQRIENNEETH